MKERDSEIELPGIPLVYRVNSMAKRSFKGIWWR
jgi:hypothetical protein